MAVREGDRVIQPSYGVGEVVEVTGERVTISFDDGVVRKFVTSMVQLTSSDSPRRERPKSKGRARKAAAASKPSPKDAAE